MSDKDLSEKQIDWNIVGYIMSSEVRFKILSLLNENKLTPSQMKDELDISMSHISNELRSLRNKGLVECINPEMKKGRLYQLTKNGYKIYNQVINIRKR